MGQQRFSFTDRKESSGTVNDQRRVRSKVTKQECLPCMSPHSKRQLFVGYGDSLISVIRFIPFVFNELRKPKSVEYIRVCEVSFVSMSGT